VADDVDFSRDVQPILTKYCTGCHNAQESESDVRLHNFENVMKGGPDGAIVLPGNAKGSPLLQLMLGSLDPQMPPEDAAQPRREEIAVLQKWIEQGAKGESRNLPLRERLKVPSTVPAAHQARSAIVSMGLLGKDRLALGRYDAVSIRLNQWSEPMPLDVVGKVTQIRTTRDGRFAVIVAGVPGVGGQATVLETQSASEPPRVVRVIEGHRDSLYSGVLSPDGQLLATGGYDRTIMLWDVATGQLLRSLVGHNGAIYDLDFDVTGKILASASADETIKVWRVHDGERLDTFGQCEAEQYVVRFDSHRNRILAAGADKRIRAWQLASKDVPAVSPMLFATYAHEAAVTQLVISADEQYLVTAGEDKQVKLWNADDLSPLGKIGSLEDVPSGLVWPRQQDRILVSSLRGSIKELDVQPYLLSTHSKPGLSTSTRQERIAFPNTDATQLEEPVGKRSVASALVLPAPVHIRGVLHHEDAIGEYAGDWYAMHAKANEPWVLEINASRSGSPMDSLIDILDEKGEPIVRTRLQATRESYFTFRGKDSSIADDFRLHRWEDMELNEYLYAAGEVVKLWLYPRGPDSGFKVYPGFGKRFTYFDTTATTHALNEPAWIVRELAENEPAIPNGLPIFPIYYSNDDDGNRIGGTDSKITFVPKQDGKFLIRIRDARGAAGDKFGYTLSINRPKPRFEFRLEQKEIVLRPGVGTEFSLVVDRFDGCDGEIQVRMEGVPEGIHIKQPLTIQAGQHKAIGSLHAPTTLDGISEFKVQFHCETKNGDRTIVAPEAKELLVKVNPKPTMQLKVVKLGQPGDAAPIEELQIRPGQTISAQLVIERGENKADIAFGGDDSGRNLPHGCYVDNIGLSGLLIPAGQSTREVFITAAPWVEPQTRLFHLRANVEGSPTTLPILIRVVSDTAAR
jgi:hypothetical protein